MDTPLCRDGRFSSSPGRLPFGGGSFPAAKFLGSVVLGDDYIVDGGPVPTQGLLIDSPGHACYSDRREESKILAFANVALPEEF